IGIGVNCAAHPEDMDFPATDLAATGALVVPDALFAALSAAMERRLGQWKQGKGFAAIRGDWLKRAASLGERLSVRLPCREVSGRFKGRDDAGRFLLEHDGGVTPITAGEVFGFGEL